MQRAEKIAGCVAGAARKNEYLQLITSAGFANVQILRLHRLKIAHDNDALESITIRGYLNNKKNNNL